MTDKPWLYSCLYSVQQVAKNVLTVTVVFFFCITSANANIDSTPKAVKVIKTLEITTVQHDSIEYFSRVLDAALQASEAEFGPYEIEHVEISHSQTRALKLLNQGHTLDVLHSMSSKTREEEFTAIKVPLLKGLMGMRLVFIDQKNKAAFDNASIEQIKAKMACQGRDWPDSDILEFNGFTVSRVLVLDAMFSMVAKSRCDYFPRGIHEIYPEFNAINSKYPNLMIYEGMMFKYHAPMYFFVGKKNHALAKRLTKGLKIIYQNGKLHALLNEASFTQNILPLSKWKGVKTIELINPDYY